MTRLTERSKRTGMAWYQNQFATAKRLEIPRHPGPEPCIQIQLLLRNIVSELDTGAFLSEWFPGRVGIPYFFVWLVFIVVQSPNTTPQDNRK